MSIFRIKKTNNYTVMCNYHLRDKKLSYKAKGLLSFMLSLPDDWDYSLNGLCSISKESKDGIRAILKELQINKYLKIEKTRGNKGYFEYNYLIYEIPYTETPYMDYPNVEIPTQIKLNKQIDKDDKTNLPSFFMNEEHNKLTQELIKKKYISINDYQLFNYDELFNQLLNEGYSYSYLMQIIHYITKKVICRNFIDENGNHIENKFGYFKNSIINTANWLKNII